MRSFLMTALLACLLLLSASGCTRQEVDPGLVGTWQLPTGGGVMTWEIRADGTYQIVANGAVVHAGTFRASGGQWSLKSPTWGEDGGTYRLADNNTFVGTGTLGPATWTRVGAAPVSGAASQSAKSVAPSAPTPPESLSSRVAALMARINEDYRDAFSYGYLGDGESEVERATSVTLEKGFVLTWHHLRCVRTDRKYDVDADKGETLARDCDRGVNGLAWNAGQTTIPLVLADSPFKVSGGEKSIRIVWTRPLPGDYEEQVTSFMSCKSPQACARMEEDLQEVLNLMTDTIAAAKARSKLQ